jgi:dCMP deaminase
MRAARVTRDEYLMDIAQVVAARSTCDRLQVGAVIARSGRVLSTGYNGAPSGMPHCDHTCTCDEDYPDQDYQLTLHRPTCPAGPCNNTIHAEANAIIFAARHGVATENAEMFVTHAPCLICARLIINAGIMGVMYSVEYRDPSGVDLLRSQAVALARV